MPFPIDLDLSTLAQVTTTKTAKTLLTVLQEEGLVRRCQCASPVICRERPEDATKCMDPRKSEIDEERANGHTIDQCQPMHQNHDMEIKHHRVGAYGHCRLASLGETLQSPLELSQITPFITETS